METTSITLILNAWYQQINQTTELFDSLNDEQLLRPIAPGRNSGKYLLGHMTAVHDGIMPILGLGEKLYPELEEAFVIQPYKSDEEPPSLSSLRNCWNEVNRRLNDEIAKIDAPEWLARHQAVSHEDFLKAPHRCKLNVLLNRMNHLSYHMGQLILLKNSKTENT